MRRFLGSTALAVLTFVVTLAAGASAQEAKPKSDAKEKGAKPFADLTIDDDVKDVAAQDLRALGDEQKRYFLIAAKEKKAPASGYGLLVVMPGGTGEAGMHNFVRRIAANAAPSDWLVAQLVSVKWKADQQVVWPTRFSRVPEMKFTTEEYFAAVVDDVRKTQKLKVDPARVFQLGWSSGGPAEYAIALQEKRLVTGSYVAMSVFPDHELGRDLELAKGQAFFLDHATDDVVCKFADSERAKKTLGEKGAVVELVASKGGHGWSDDPFSRLKRGFEWLDQNHRKAPR